MGEWKAAYMFDDYTIVCRRVWDYGDFAPDRGSHKQTREDARASRHRVEKWVAKHLIKTNQIDRFGSVTEYFRANPAHAAQWGRRSRDTYLSFYIPMAYVIGAAAGHLAPMYPTHRKDADILASHRLTADIRNYMVLSTGYDEKNLKG